MSQQTSLEDYKKAVAEEEERQYGHLGQPSVVTSEWDWLWQMYLNSNLSPAAALTAFVMGY